MSTIFTRLNDGWSAEPNAPAVRIATVERNVVVAFRLNPYQYPRFRQGDLARLHFLDCWRYMLGSINDEGWYGGQCRFGGVAPAWGEFYEVGGDLRLGETTGHWTTGPAPAAEPSRHFLFYFRDETFECDAADWQLEIVEGSSS